MLLRSILRSAKRRLVRNVSTGFSSSLTTDYLSGSDKGIVVVGLNSSKNKNALSRVLTQSLQATFDEITTNSEARVVIIRSLIPKVFCAGADLKERLSMPESEVKLFVNSLRNLMMKIENTPIPVISAINGTALGGGLEMALSCDIRIATESARLGLVETKLAIIPGAGGTQRLPRLIGASLAKELIFTARVLNGKEAKSYGIVNHCTPDNSEGDSAFQKAIDIAREILPNGPLGIKLAKVAINKGSDVDINQGCAIEELCYSQVIPTKDRIEGLRAFQEKRMAVYVGE